MEWKLDKKRLPYHHNSHMTLIDSSAKYNNSAIHKGQLGGGCGVEEKADERAQEDNKI